MNKIIEKYLQLVIQHGEEIQKGNSTNANKLHKKITALVAKENLDLTQNVSLLKHPSISVRLWVASNLIKKDIREAYQVLKEIQESNEIFSLNARIIIDLYKKGKLV